MILENMPLFRDLNLFSIVFRVLLAMLLSGILGYEREKKHRPAGFRTYMVVCLGSALAMMTGIYLNTLTGNGDPGRIAAQVISGIGFLGAGTILVTKQNQVKGLTTAAGLWAVACLGLAVGAGFYTGAIGISIALWSSLRILRFVDKRIFAMSKNLHLYIEFSGINEVSHFISYAKENRCTISNMEMTRSKNPDGSVAVSAILTLHTPEVMPHAQVIETYGKQEGIIFIEEV